MKLCPLGILSGVVACALSASPLAAQQGGGAGTAPHYIGSAQGSRLSTLLGGAVAGADGTTLGVIDDVVLDEQGRVAFVIVDVTGDRGLGDKTIAVPYAALSTETSAAGTPGAVGAGARAQPRTVRVRLALTQQQLAAAPSFQVEKSRSAGTPESTGRPKSSTESGGPG